MGLGFVGKAPYMQLSAYRNTFRLGEIKERLSSLAETRSSRQGLMCKGASGKNPKFGISTGCPLHASPLTPASTLYISHIPHLKPLSPFQINHLILIPNHLANQIW